MSFFGGKIGVNIFLKGYILGTSTIAKKNMGGQMKEHGLQFARERLYECE